MFSSAKSEPALSPVLGTILLVAITVALIAIIMAVVLGMSGDQSKKEVGIGINPSDKGGANVILYGGNSIPELVRLDVLDAESSRGVYVTVWNISETGQPLSGGEVLYGKYVARPLRDIKYYPTTLIIRGIFSDGTEQILYKGQAEFHEPVSMMQYITSARFGVDLTDRYRETIAGMTTTGVASGVAGYATYANFVANAPKRGGYLLEPYPVSHYVFEVESVHPDREEISGYITYLSTGDLSRGNAGYSGATRDGIYYEWHITNWQSNGVYVYTGVPNEGGPWKFTLTIYGTDGSILSSEYWYVVR